MYAVCKQVFFKTGRKETQIDRHTGRAVTVEIWGADFSEYETTTVHDMAEAKRLYGGSPILEAVRK